MSDNSELALAFPSHLHDDAIQAIGALPLPTHNTGTFSVRVDGESLSIPYRIYHDPGLIDTSRLTNRQTELLDCLLTRHHSGFVREDHLARIIRSNNNWTPPFIVQLLGEYVIEILHAIQKETGNLDTGLYRSFLLDNPTFFAITRERVISYWNCYHRWQRKDDYPGFQILDFFTRLLVKND